ERVCGEDLDGDVLEALDSLVEQSLVRQSEGADGQPRFRMLQTIREFAMEQAIESGRWDALRERHAQLFRELAEESGSQVMSSNKRPWLDRLEEEHDNLRAAFAWAQDVQAAELSLRMSASLWRFWQMRGYLAEGLDRTTQALAMPHAADHPEARADALSAAAGLAYWLADAQKARGFYEQEIEARTALNDRRGLAEALYGISFTWSIIELGTADAASNATRYVTAALRIYEELEDAPGIGRCEWALANVAWGGRDLETARAHAVRALETFESIDDRFNFGWASYTLGLAALSELATEGTPKQLEEARWRLSEALRIFDEAQDVTGYSLVLDAFAILALHEGDRQRAARLSGAVSRLERLSGTGLNTWNRGVLKFEPAELHADPSLAEAWAEGEAFSPSEAVAYALES
ncbi:MAG: hypothetical protein M3Y34_00540, partial [Actinomycetota bacterium]|nr:hypothetical protein [Actinomycetota bacterium]